MAFRDENDGEELGNEPYLTYVCCWLGAQNPAQMRGAQDDEMIHTLAPDRSDQPFGKAILPGRS